MAENHLHSKWHYFMGKKMYKSSEEEKCNQTSAEGEEVGQASLTAIEVCIPQSLSRVLYGKFFAAPHLPGYFTGNCTEVYISLNQMFGEYFSHFCSLPLTNFITSISSFDRISNIISFKHSSTDDFFSRAPQIPSWFAKASSVFTCMFVGQKPSF